MGRIDFEDIRDIMASLLCLCAFIAFIAIMVFGWVPGCMRGNHVARENELLKENLELRMSKTKYVHDTIIEYDDESAWRSGYEKGYEDGKIEGMIDEREAYEEYVEEMREEDDQPLNHY